jgi:chromosome transmission fidelity protein 4
MERDALPSSVDITPQISQQELELDKVLITLIQTSCKADKLDRALDYTSRLHHLPSFDLAQKVAEFYHLPGLKERMRLLKESKERAEGVEVEDGRLIREGWGRVLEPVPRAGIAELEPDPREGFASYRGARTSHTNNRHSLEFPPQPAVPRRSLAQAPAYPSTKSYDPQDVSSPPSMPADDPFIADSSMAETQDTFNLKRKHGEDNEGHDPRKRTSPILERTPAAAPAVKGPQIHRGSAT